MSGRHSKHHELPKGCAASIIMVPVSEHYHRKAPIGASSVYSSRALPAEMQSSRPASFSNPDNQNWAPLPKTDQSASKAETKRTRKKHAHHKHSHHIRRISIAICAIALIILCALAGIAAAMESGAENLHQEAVDIKTGKNAISYDEGKTIVFDGHSYVYNENVVSICVIGNDREDIDAVAGHEGQADAVMVLAMDTESGKTTVIGIPRDSMVEVGEYAGEAFEGLSTMQLCLAYSYGQDDFKSSELTTTIVKRILYNMPINYFFTLDMASIGELADAVGGVVLTPIQSIPGTPIKKDQSTILFGDNAYSYLQYRNINQLTSPLDRMARQEQYLKAYASQVLKSAQDDVRTMLDLYNIARCYSTTNLGTFEFAYLAQCLIKNGVTSIETVTLPGEIQMGNNGYAEYQLDKTAVYKTVLDVYYTQNNENHL